MKKQTAVQWLVEKFNQCEPMYSGIKSNAHKEYLEKLIEQAKEMEKMENEFVSYEIALKLKELGFDEQCICGYNDYHLLRSKISSSFDGDFVKWDKKYDKDLKVPLYQQVFRWFREKHNIHSNIKCVNTTHNNHFRFEIESNGETLVCRNRFDSYEEAELACLLKLIEITNDTNRNI